MALGIEPKAEFFLCNIPAAQSSSKAYDLLAAISGNNGGVGHHARDALRRLRVELGRLAADAVVRQLELALAVVELPAALVPAVAPAGPDAYAES